MGYAVCRADKRLCLSPCPIAREPAFSKPAANKGFTLIELLITIAIILTVCAIAVPNLLAALDLAKMAKAVGDVRAIGDDIQAYDLGNGQYPATLADINRDTFPDPWGHPYQYLNFADTKGKGAMRKDRFLVPINSYFDLYSMGKDGLSVPPLPPKVSQDDIIWANDGDYIGLASRY
jgi:general secretion pathway protein G